MGRWVDLKSELTLPPEGERVWVKEVFYYGGVTTGYRHGRTWFVDVTNDDCHVTHWMPMTEPDPPAEGAE